MAKKAVKGGKVFDRLLKKAAVRQSSEVRVGFFPTARYPTMQTVVNGQPRQWNGEYVAEVAAKNEYGVGVPARPFFRQALPQIESQMKVMAPKITDPVTQDISQAGLELIGEMAVGVVQESITDLSQPPNAPATIRMKRSSNPLIDTGFMRESVSWEVG